MNTKRIEILDHGYIEIIETWGSDERIIESARMSTGKGFNGWGPKCKACGEPFSPPSGLFGTNDVECPSCKACYAAEPGDEKLLRFLWENKHATPFEMAGATIEIKAPIFVFREWHRHRTQCLAGDTMLHFESPKSDKLGRRCIYKMPIAEAWRKWQLTTRASRPERQTEEHAAWSRNRIAGMRLRCANEDTREVVLTHITDIIRGDLKTLLRVTTIGGKTIRASADHKFFTNRGWMRLEDAISAGALLAVERTAREMAMSWETPPVDEAKETWRDVVGWCGIYEVSSEGRVRRCGKSPKRGTVADNGYVVVSLNRPGMQQTRTVHQLVLEAFVGDKPIGMECRHLNSNRIDCRLENLAWGTSLENAQDRIDAGRQQRLTVGFEEIAEWRADGHEVTYDIAVADPWHNFVADGFVVHNSYNEMSARYTPLPNENYIPSIERLMLGSDGKNKQAGTVAGAEALTVENAEWFRKTLDAAYAAEELLYQEALRVGVPKELARVHLPVGRYSRMRATANLRNWLAFLSLRSTTKNPAAQWEIRQFADALHGLLVEPFPRTLDLFNG